MANFWQKLPRPFTVLAPMIGVTDYAFREVVSNYLPKPDVMFTEFTNVNALTSKGYQKTIPMFKFSESQRLIVAQIWGIDPEKFYLVAKMIVKLGFDGIDINMGCPERSATNGGAGAALIDNPNLAKEIIKATKEGAGKLPVSVKTRNGYKIVSTERWISLLLEQKLDALTLHGRTAKQMSRGEANWDDIGKTVELKNEISPKTVIIGNGDIMSFSQAIEMHIKYKVDGVMIGRGIFSNPWVFEKEPKNHTFEESKNILVRHLKLCSNEYSDEVKKFYKMYVNNFDGASKLRSELMQTKAIDEALKILK